MSGGRATVHVNLSNGVWHKRRDSVDEKARNSFMRQVYISVGHNIVFAHLLAPA